jgi:hypothetical protein
MHDLHDSTEAVVAALAGVCVAVFQLVRITAVSLRSTSSTMAGVEVAIRVDSSSLVATVAVKVKGRLELVLGLIRTPGESCEDVSLDVLGHRRG